MQTETKTRPADPRGPQGGNRVSEGGSRKKISAGKRRIAVKSSPGPSSPRPSPPLRGREGEKLPREKSNGVRKRQTRAEYLELQRLMAGAVMRPLTADDNMQTRSQNGRSMAKVASEFIKPNDRLTAFERLEIYNRQYWFRLRDCFYDDYPGLRAVLGDRQFARMAEAYLTKFPSASYSLRNLGSRLLNFLADEPEWIAAQKTLALDMARLEWAQIEAFDNEALPKLTMDSLLEINPEKTRLTLQPHLSLLELNHPVDEFLVNLRQTDRLRDEASNAMESRPDRSSRRITAKKKASTLYLAVHRHDDSVYYKRLEHGAFVILSAFRKTSTVAGACQELGAVEGDPAELGAKIQDWFRAWAALGWLCRAT